MESEIIIVEASGQDVNGIVSILEANRDDPSMFLRLHAAVNKNLKDFFVAKDARGEIVGCAAVHQYSPILAEILSVAVLPEFQGHGLGNRIMDKCMQRAEADGIEHLWLVHQALNPDPHKLVLFLLLGVGKILIMLRHNSGFPALIRRKITLSMEFIT